MFLMPTSPPNVLIGLKLNIEKLHIIHKSQQTRLRFSFKRFSVKQMKETERKKKGKRIAREIFRRVVLYSLFYHDIGFGLCFRIYNTLISIFAQIQSGMHNTSTHVNKCNRLLFRVETEKAGTPFAEFFI